MCACVLWRQLNDIVKEFGKVSKVELQKDTATQKSKVHVVVAWACLSALSVHVKQLSRG